MDNTTNMATNVNNNNETISDPLFVRLCDIKPLFKGNMTLLIFNLSKEIASNGVLCVQRFKGVFKIYLRDERDKTGLLIYGLQYNGNNIDVYESNPFEADSRSFISEKIIVKNLPFNISNKRVFEELEGINNLKIMSKIMFSRERDDSNNLTDCLNGDRFFMQRGQ